MAGRKKKPLIHHYRDITIIVKGVIELLLGHIQIKCPLCGSWKVSTNGTRPRKDKRVEAFTFN